MFKQGINTLKDVFKQVLVLKRASLVFFLSSFMVAVTEMAFLGSLYALFSSDKKTFIFNWFKSKTYLTISQLSFIERNLIFILIGISVCILLFRLFSAILSRFSLALIQTKITIKLSNKLLSCYIDAHPVIWTSWKREKIVNIITNEAGASAEAIYTAMNMLISIIIAIALIIVAYFISPPLTTFCVLIGICALALNYFNYARARRLGAIKVKSKSQLLAHVFNIISGHKILKLESAEEIAKAKLSGIVDKSYYWLLGRARNINFVMSLSEVFIYFFFFGLVIIAQVFKIFDQAIMLTLLIFAIRLQATLTDIQAQWMRYQELLPNFIDVQKMLSYASQHILEKKEIMPSRKINYKEGYTVRLERTTFSYSGNGPLILEDINLVFPGGGRFLIKGASGSGKSTFINILCGILKPTSGKVYFNDEELTMESFYNLRNYISYSSPDAYIFRGTLKDNISLGLTVSDEEIMGAVRKAGSEWFVNSLDNGIYSNIADNAADISLGERQRLMLARMFLKDPALVLLDEATSNLDLELEDKILNNLVEHLSKATIIMVTHRAPKDFVFDARFELKDGKLVKIS